MKLRSSKAESLDSVLVIGRVWKTFVFSKKGAGKGVPGSVEMTMQSLSEEQCTPD